MTGRGDGRGVPSTPAKDSLVKRIPADARSLRAHQSEDVTQEQGKKQEEVRSRTHIQ
jgi:hypothetical protein